MWPLWTECTGLTKFQDGPSIGCPSRTKFCSSDFCFAPKLNHGLDNFKLFFRNFPTLGSLTPMSSKISIVFLYNPIYGYIAGISDDSEMKDPEVGKSWIFFHKLSRPRVITNAKEKFEFEKKNRSYSYITEICDGTGVRDPEVGRFRFFFLSYSGQGSTLVESRKMTWKILFQRDTLTINHVQTINLRPSPWFE